ncbi:hypothetical protein Hanom_Chr07g00631831 [Helianthus anomalus]
MSKLLFESFYFNDFNHLNKISKSLMHLLFNHSFYNITFEFGKPLKTLQIERFGLQGVKVSF